MNPERIQAALDAYDAVLRDRTAQRPEEPGDRYEAMAIALEEGDRFVGLIAARPTDGFRIALSLDLPPHKLRLVGENSVATLDLATGTIERVEKVLPPTIQSAEGETLVQEGAVGVGQSPA